ncbi:lipocalin family protein [Agrobacterium sp. NPDC090273]|uniref:lipocalin family protein n=1 Tax=Agrobacterium sp. NPDC090273 TaxID=3363919 RepID=UPI00383B9306
MGPRSCVPTFLLIALGLVSSFTTDAGATPKVVKVGPDHYRGTWLEIGRTPMFLTDGCVAGYSTYRRGVKPDDVIVEDGCYVDTPAGRLKTVRGTGKIEDFGTTNAKMRVRYPLLITFNYWVLYKSPDKTWFISATPSMSDLWIYSRTVPTNAQLKRMIRKASELGYDVQKLEFPPAR